MKLVIALLLLAATAVRAEVTIQEVHWGLRAPGPAGEWAQPPVRRVSRPPRVLVTLVNDGPQVEGLVLRYAVSAKSANAKDEASAGEWSVPFWMSESRVPVLKAKQTLTIAIDDLRLVTSLGEMYRAGFWPTALKIEVMIKPRLGDMKLHAVSEGTFPVVWKRKSP